METFLSNEMWNNFPVLLKSFHELKSDESRDVLSKEVSMLAILNGNQGNVGNSNKRIVSNLGAFWPGRPALPMPFCAKSGPLLGSPSPPPRDWPQGCKTRSLPLCLVKLWPAPPIGGGLLSHSILAWQTLALERQGLSLSHVSVACQPFWMFVHVSAEIFAKPSTKYQTNHSRVLERSSCRSRMMEFLKCWWSLREDNHRKESKGGVKEFVTFFG